MAGDEPSKRRPRVKHTGSFKERLLQAAREAREEAALLPPGSLRDRLLRRARSSETAANIDAWISSPGLRPPEELAGLTQKAPRPKV
jgi:hypothetical protein